MRHLRHPVARADPRTAPCLQPNRRSIPTIRAMTAALFAQRRYRSMCQAATAALRHPRRSTRLSTMRTAHSSVEYLPANDRSSVPTPYSPHQWYSGQLLNRRDRTLSRRLERNQRRNREPAGVGIGCHQRNCGRSCRRHLPALLQATTPRPPLLRNARVKFPMSAPKIILGIFSRGRYPSSQEGRIRSIAGSPY